MGRVVELTRQDDTNVIYDDDLNGNLDGFAVYDTQLNVVPSMVMDISSDDIYVSDINTGG